MSAIPFEAGRSLMSHLMLGFFPWPPSPYLHLPYIPLPSGDLIINGSQYI